MKLFNWSPRYAIGIPQIDSEHQQLFVLAEQLYEAMRTGASKADVEKTLSGLITYCGSHFRDEEAVMRKSGYPELESHRLLHEDLTRQVLKFQQEFQAGRVTLSIDLLTFLKDWLVKHISGCDSRIAVHLREAGRRPMVHA